MSETLYGTDDGFRRAMANANRKRLRSLGTATCATALVVALTGSLVPAQHSSGKGRLDMVTTPVTPRPPVQVPDADPYVPPPAEDAQPRAVAGAPSRVRAPEAGVARDESTPARRAPRKPWSSTMSRGYAGLVPNVSCAVYEGGWCFKTAGTVPEHPAHSRTLEVDLCGAGSETRLVFDTSAEVEMAVTDLKGRVLWSWLADHPPTKQPHAITYATGAPCLRWKAKWYERTNAGVPLGPGRYRFVARLLARTPAGIPTSATEFTL